MKPLSILVSVLAMAAAPIALGNDTAAVLRTGGLEFVTNEQIHMESEALFISASEIRVVYRFVNESEADQNVLVAFPMPDIASDWWMPSALPLGPADNPFEFETLFNGEPAEAELHQYAYALGVDRTQYLIDHDVPLLSSDPAVLDAIAALDAGTQAEMEHLGLIAPDPYAVDDGTQTYYVPAWIWRASYTWEAEFPAGEAVTVEHRYTPSVGGTAGVSFFTEPYDGYDPAAEYAVKYCTDKAFLNAVRQAGPAGEPWQAPFTEQWISYILTTGGNWAGGTIDNFRLTVDKGEADNLVSFCGEDVTKTGPTTFEMVKTDYWPDRDIDILILDRYEPQ